MKTFIMFFLLLCTYVKAEQTYALVRGESPVTITDASESIGATWLNGKIHDHPLIQKTYSQLKKLPEDFVFIDIGAQTGCFSLLAKYFPKSRWYAFEPVEEASTELKANLALNAIQNVTIVKKGASNFPGSDVIRLPKDTHWGLATLGKTAVRFHEYDERLIELITLDDFIAQSGLSRVDFIKIDTEGWELNVLKGAESVLRRFHPIILLECNDDNLKQTGTQKSDLFNYLKSFGYKYARVSREDLLCMPLHKE